MLHFHVGEVVERREFFTTTRGTVVHVTANGGVVTAQWYVGSASKARRRTILMN